MGNGILHKEKPVREALQSLRQAKEALSVAKSFMASWAVGESINEIVYYKLFQQTEDTINGVSLCIETLENSISHGETVHPILRNSSAYPKP